jgi:hypothetical protein
MEGGWKAEYQTYRGFISQTRRAIHKRNKNSSKIISKKITKKKPKNPKPNHFAKKCKKRKQISNPQH